MKKIIIAITGVVLVAIAGVATYTYFNNSANAATPNTEAPIESMFYFDNSKTPDWQQGASNETSMAVFKMDTTSSCFLSAEYYQRELAVDKELDDVQSAITSIDNTVSQVGEKNRSFNGTPYVLHLLDVIPGAHPPKTGLAYGFIPHKNGFIKLYSICDRPDQRESTYGALDGVRLRK